MAKIIGVHGIGQMVEGEESLKKDWLPALKDGLTRANARLNGEDLGIAFYGDLFRPEGARGGIPLYEAQDVDDDWERELLGLWWREAAARSSVNREEGRVVSPDEKARWRTPEFVQNALNALASSRYFSKLFGEEGEHVLIFGLKQVRLYLHDPKIKEAALTRLSEAIGDDTRVVIGHSLGSVLAYEALCANPDWPVNTLITLGSPLGIDNLIFDRLIPSPVNGKGQWPNVDRWFNITDNGDIVALVKELDGKFNGFVEDHRVHNGWKSHAIGPYLTSEITGNAIATGI